MPRNATTGVFTRVSNSFSNPVFGTLIDPTDAEALFDDQDVGLNPPKLAGPLAVVGGIVGTTTNDSAAVGIVGEYVESILVLGSATALTTATSKTVTSISLTAGDWDVDCITNFLPNAATSISRYSASLSLVTNTFDATAGRFVQTVIPATVLGALNLSAPIPNYRFSLGGTTSIFMVAEAAFTINTLAAWGIIRARRVR